MSPNEALAKQILAGYLDGQVDLKNVPDLQKVAREAAAQQMAAMYDTTDFHQKQMAALASEKSWYHQQINRILNEKLAKLDTHQLENAVVADLRRQQVQLQEQQQRFAQTVSDAKATQRQQFWQALTPSLAGGAVCLLLASVFFFVLEKLIYQGIWQSWGLHQLYNTVLALQPSHPYGAIILGLLGFILMAGAIYASFWLLVHAVQLLADFKPAKLLFWRKKKIIILGPKTSQNANSDVLRGLPAERQSRLFSEPPVLILNFLFVSRSSVKKIKN